MEKYNKYIEIVKIILIATIFKEIIFQNVNYKNLLIFVLIISLLNDFIRRRVIKQKNLIYIASILFSTAIAGILKYYVGSAADGYFYICLVETLFKDKTKKFVGLAAFNYISFIASDLLTVWLKHDSEFSVAVSDIFYYLIGMFIVISVKEMRKQKEQLQELNLELHEKNKLLEHQKSQLKELSIAEERNRLAQELHDSLGHSLVAINMHLKVLEKVKHTDNEKVDEILENLDNITQSSIVQLRKTVYKLKGDNSTKQLKKALEETIDTVMVDRSVKISMEFDDEVEKNSPEIKAVIYKSIRECLTNTIKYAKASNVKIIIYKGDTNIHIEVNDDGLGCSKIEKSYGLLGIEERISRIGGHTTFESKEKLGFIFRAVIPVVRA
ncbi:sensor histidine kinase [Clostridium hydrogenum]|uniref:sensor histidine kinase n=1 Tax=Clostridium hydrogenum TaxID=2855764 RepID=UPI001F307F0B|nr:sensor histidine kinase [Clostridium hydrogenum]